MTTLATFNCGNRPDRLVANGLDRLVAHGADIFGLQECGDRGPMLNRWCAASGWQLWPGDAPGSPSTPILWNPRAVRALHTDTRPATPATDTGRLGAGPNVVKPKVWNWVRFETEDRADLLFINGHLPASVWAPRRRALAARQIAVLADLVEHREPAVDGGRLDVAAVGDFNCKPSDRLTKPLRRLGMTQHSRGGTHGRRTIDHVWTLGLNGRAEVVRMPSDHRSVVFTVGSR